MVSGRNSPATPSRAWISTLPTERQLPTRITPRQWHLGAARDQRSTSCRIKFGRRRTGFLAGESLQHWLSQTGIDRNGRLETSRSEDGPALVRQLAHRNRGLAGNSGSWLPRSGNCSLLQHCKPSAELLSAAIIAVRRFLGLAIAVFRRAGNPHMEVIVVVPPRPHLGQPI